MHTSLMMTMTVVMARVPYSISSFGVQYWIKMKDKWLKNKEIRSHGRYDVGVKAKHQN